MTFAPKPEMPPLREEPEGVLRIGKTRVLLELVIEAFQNGATPEAIVESYDALSLSDVYAVIAYYLNHRSEVDEYLRCRRQRGDEMKLQVNSAQDLKWIRERIIKARQT